MFSNFKVIMIAIISVLNLNQALSATSVTYKNFIGRSYNESVDKCLEVGGDPKVTRLVAGRYRTRCRIESDGVKEIITFHAGPYCIPETTMISMPADYAESLSSLQLKCTQYWGNLYLTPNGKLSVRSISVDGHCVERNLGLGMDFQPACYNILSVRHSLNN